MAINTPISGGGGSDVTSAAVVEALDGASSIADVTPVSGDKFLIKDASDGGALKEVDYDDLPGVGGGLSNIVEDVTPQLGGDLDVNGQQIVSVTGTDIDLHSDNNIVLTLGDAAGADKLSITDSADVEVASIDSDGGASVTSLNVNGGNVTSVDNISLSTSPTPLTSEGALYYDATNKCPVYKNDEADVTHQIGQESWVRVYNDSGSTINNGQLVYISGKEDTEDRPTIALAIASSSATATVIGMATHDIENATFGYVTQFGVINDINTAAFSDGAPVWLSDTVAGALTATAPLSPSVSVFIGWVLDSDATAGNLFFTTIGNTSGTTVAGEATELFILARKGTAGTINVGQPVYISGAYNTGTGTVTVELADADGSGTYPAIGICSATITNASTGRITVSGRINGLDTSSYSVNDTLYLSTTAGALTTTKPVGSAQIQAVARVLRSNVSGGIIEVVGAGRTNDVPNFTAADRFWYGGTSGVVTEGTITTAGRAILDDADAAAQRATLSAAGITGTPSDGQIAVWTGSTIIEGDSALTFDTTDDTLVIAASGKLAFGAVDVLSDSAGTTTLQNIDALDATTEATIEAAIDTLDDVLYNGSQTATLGTTPAPGIDCGTGVFFEYAMSGNVTFTLSNIPSNVYVMRLRIVYTSGTATWTNFTSLEWAGGSAPSFTAGSEYDIIFSTDDGGTTWRAIANEGYS